MDVRLIKSFDDVALVEFVKDGMTFRRYIPISFVDISATAAVPGFHSVPDDVVDAGVEYGDDFSEIVKLNSGDIVNKIVNALHQRNVWSFCDVQCGYKEVYAAFVSVANSLTISFVDEAKIEGKKAKENKNG